jgi:hypothetical protein
MHIRIANPVEYRYFSGNIDLSMNLDARLCASEFCPSKDRHTQIDGGRVNGIEPPVKFKLLGDTLGLGDRYQVKGKFFKDFRVSKVICFGKNASVDRSLTKTQVKRSFGMSNRDIGEFSKTMTTYKLTVDNDQHMTPVRWSHTGASIFVFDYQPFEVALGEKLYYLRENIFADVHIRSNLHMSAKELNSKGRQGF